MEDHSSTGDTLVILDLHATDSFGRMLEAHGKTELQFQAECLSLLREWCELHRNKLQHVLVTVKGDELHWIVNQSIPPQNFEMSRSLSDRSCILADRGWHPASLQLGGGPEPLSELHYMSNNIAEENRIMPHGSDPEDMLEESA